MWVANLLILKSFELWTEGELVCVVIDERWAHLIASDYARVVDRWPLVTPFASIDSKYGPSQSRPDVAL
jgi:hypothetical protein